MKPRLLIVSEDVVKIQTFSGKLGQIYSSLYQFFLRTKISLAILLYSPWFDITLLSSDATRQKKVNSIIYSQILDRNKFAKFKPLAWSLTSKVFHSINKGNRSFLQYQSIWLTKLWENKVSIYLMYDYLSYYWLFQNLIQSKTYSSVLLIDNSLQSQLANFIASKRKIKIYNCSFLSLNFLTNKLSQYFRYRELKRKLDEFKKRSQLYKPKFAKQSVIMCAAFFRQLKTLVPVYLKLKQLKLNPWFATEIPQINLYLNNLQLKEYRSVFFAPYLPKATWKRLNGWSKIVRKIENRFVYSYTKGVKTEKDFLISLFLNEMVPIIRHGLILARLYLESADNLIDKLKPRSIVVAGDVRLSELALANIALKKRIPSLTVSSRTMIFDEETYRYDSTNHFAVTGEHTKSKLIDLGVRPQKIHVLGDPRYDHLAMVQKKFDRSQVLKDLNIEKHKKIVLLISFRSNPSLSLEEKRDFLKLSYLAVKKLKDAILVIKPHPTEKRYRVIEQIKKWGMSDVVVSNNQKVELFDLLNACSVVLLTWSMTGLEAMMLDRPVVVVNPHQKNYDQFIPYVKIGAAKEVSNLPDLKRVIVQLIDSKNKNRRELISAAKKLSNYFIKIPDGKASDRIAKLINSF